MSKVKKTIKEYDEEGNLIKETVIEEDKENNELPFIPDCPNPYKKPPWDDDIWIGTGSGEARWPDKMFSSTDCSDIQEKIKNGEILVIL